MSFQDTLDELRFGGPEIRVRAAAKLAQTKDPASFEPLFETLDDPEPEVRAAGAEALAAVQNSKAVAKLVELLKDKSWIVREAAATTLGVLGESSSSRALLELVEKNYRRDITSQRQHQAIMESIIALGRIKDARAESLLVKVLRKGYKNAVSDWQLQVRQAGAIGLGYLDQPGGVDALLDVLSSEDRREIREAAITALSLLKSETSFNKLVAALNLRVLEHPERAWPRQQAAVIALGKMANPKALPYLFPVVNNEFPEVRMALTETLARLGEAGEPGAKEVLLKLLRDRIAEVRAGAAQALGKLQISDASNALNVVLKDPSRLVAGAAQVALDQIKALPPGGGPAQG